jgi:hypothetical protein
MKSKTKKLTTISLKAIRKDGTTICLKNTTAQRISQMLASRSEKKVILRYWLKVQYDKESSNEIETNDPADIKWALKAFLDL